MYEKSVVGSGEHSGNGTPIYIILRGFDKVRHICYNVCMIKGCVGFSRIGNSLITHMLLVRGKRVVEVPLICAIIYTNDKGLEQ